MFGSSQNVEKAEFQWSGRLGRSEHVFSKFLFKNVISTKSVWWLFSYAKWCEMQINGKDSEQVGNSLEMCN